MLRVLDGADLAPSEPQSRLRMPFSSASLPLVAMPLLWQKDPALAELKYDTSKGGIYP